MSQSNLSDAVDQISERLTSVLLNNQELDFSRLRGLALLNSDIDNRTMYYELIVLSFIKYLKLSSTFSLEIKQDNAAYRIFNAMNLNDDTINTHFCIFLSLIAPDVINALCAVTARIASDLATANMTRYTSERLERLESKLNTLKVNENSSYQVDFETAPDANVHSKQRTVKHKQGSISLLDFLAPEPRNSRNVKAKHVRRKSKAAASASSGSDNNYSLERYINCNTLQASKIGSRIKPPSTVESASDTATRLFFQRTNATLANVDEVFAEDSASNVLPTREQIAKAKAKYSVVNDKSSVDL
jgi:hypothetical protein